MNRIGLASLLAMLVSAAGLAGEFARTDKGCLVQDWNAQRSNPSYIWSGQCVGGFADGKGILLSLVDGQVFSTTEGTLRKGSFNGPAVIQWAKGDRYEGELQNGTLSGHGTYRYPNGTTASGVFSNSQLVQADAPAAPAGGSQSAGGAAVSGEVGSVDLTGGCQAAQQKGQAYMERLGQQANNQDLGICGSARAMHKIGEMTVRVAELCHEIPTWTQLRDEGQRIIRESQETMDGSCG
ncbi:MULTISPECIES: hypothetical protein [Pseudomonas]|uniref:MORN repeat-containing protein n=1 Tax=Pseudomonas nitroreducens TaxID=46680 RepID=A0A6G6IV75_PSENT|nr:MULTISPECIES: hypothetical protein [Pseudomonas]MBG6287917.1 hypothetical protein [Pseudomonas nitroreducens]MCJ1877670.1 hypothetical protein [Pseudomonas nitroreducens]MCJ1895269.1 hypothetical protein [Pseudomonas nitroreducens]MDG9855740.1 hypothetical protein [Pseudomonas nitroreducens]MDH1075544.1 hypothetical protein [Pseudomonas nitroreducens]